MNNIKIDKLFNKKVFAIILLIGGIGALINSMLFYGIFNSRPNKDTLLITFYFVHSIITILAAILLLKYKKIGLIVTYTSFLMVLASLFINIEGKLSIFIFTVTLSLGTITSNAFFIAIATIIFLSSILLNVIFTKKWLE